MNISTLRACFQSANFRMRLHGALISSAKKGYPAYVKNRKGENFIRVEHICYDGGDPFVPTGFTFTDKQGRIIPKGLMYSMIQDA